MSSKFKKKFKPATPNNQSAAGVQVTFQQALAWHQQGQLAQAQGLYEEILAVQPRHADALHLLGVLAAQTNNPQRAVSLFDKAIAIKPDNVAYYFNRGLALQQLKQFEAALADYDRILALQPGSAEAWFNRGNILKQLKRLDAAVASYDHVIALQPDSAVTYFSRANALQELEHFAAAIAGYDQAIALKPDAAEAYYNRGLAQQQLVQPDAALASYEQAIALKPDYAEAYINRGNALQDLRQSEAALASYEQAIALRPDHAEAYSNRGLVLHELKQFEAALASYDQAIALNPDYAEAHYNRGDALQELKQRQAAIESYDKALAIKTDYDFLHGIRLHAKMHICDWHEAEKQLAELIRRIQCGEKASTPFPVLALSDSLPLQRQAAEIWVASKYPENLALGAVAQYPRHEKIRLGYFSMDFRNHPVSCLTAELFELHDRERFEVYAFSYGPDTRDAMRHRLEGAFDRFIEVRHTPDKEIAALARRMEIDIAIDLAGHTADARTGIFAMRAAPVQVNYLGYPGTMGAGYIDYLLADRQLIPGEAREHYSEKIVYLPSFQANDRKREISGKVFSREESGLPESGFVFCCCNNNYKITPSTFAGWMRILKRVEGSVLWLYEDNAAASNNLRKEAAERGVDAGRLVFAERLPVPEYLARYRCADLFLDTLPFNAGTTASDALWAGLPVLTCPGESFAGRMAASLLTAVALPELIAATQEEYEELAVGLAENPERLKAIRQKLARHRLTTPLFDTPLFTRHIEEAYAQMYERCHAGLPPDHLYVEPK